jgi:hypothetical protein
MLAGGGRLGQGGRRSTRVVAEKGPTCALPHASNSARSLERRTNELTTNVWSHKQFHALVDNALSYPDIVAAVGTVTLATMSIAPPNKKSASANTARKMAAFRHLRARSSARLELVS